MNIRTMKAMSPRQLGALAFHQGAERKVPPGRSPEWFREFLRGYDDAANRKASGKHLGRMGSASR